MSERWERLARGDKGDKGDRGERGERGEPGVSPLLRRVLVSMLAVAVLLGVLALLVVVTS